MAIVKIIENPLDTQEAVINACRYITAPEKTQNGRCVGYRGVSAEHATADIIEMQMLFGKTTGRRGYHFVVGFDSKETLATYDMIRVAEEISNLFFPQYQILYGVHPIQGHPHIHFFVNTVSLQDGKKLQIGFAELEFLREQVSRIVNVYTQV